MEANITLIHKPRSARILSVSVFINTDYKVTAAKSVNRLDDVLLSDINDDQMQFHNCREILGKSSTVYIWQADKNPPNTFHFVDAEKVFDKVDWSFI